MQDNGVKGDWIYIKLGRKKRLKIHISFFLIIYSFILIIWLLIGIVSYTNRSPKGDTLDGTLGSFGTLESDPIISPVESVEDPVIGVQDPNNTVYPYSTIGTDMVAEAYKNGFTYYELPSAYTIGGGMFPEVAQIYLWNICKEAGVDYYTVLALIERESGYRYTATGDSGKSKGLMQIQERWHRDRMEAVGATDLYNPYDNIRVGVNFLKEIQDRYLDSKGAQYVLMVYNAGATGAKRMWDQGIYSTSYSRYILQRAQEIKQELQDQ